MLQKSGATEIEIKIIKLVSTVRKLLVNMLMFMEIKQQTKNNGVSTIVTSYGFKDLNNSSRTYSSTITSQTETETDAEGAEQEKDYTILKEYGYDRSTNGYNKI